MVPPCLFGPDRKIAPALPKEQACHAFKIQTPGVQLFTFGRPQNFAHNAAGQPATSHAASHRDASSLPCTTFLPQLTWLGWFELAVGLTAPQNWRHSNGPTRKAWVAKGCGPSKRFDEIDVVALKLLLWGSKAARCGPSPFLWPQFLANALDNCK